MPYLLVSQHFRHVTALLLCLLLLLLLSLLHLLLLKDLNLLLVHLASKANLKMRSVSKRSITCFFLLSLSLLLLSLSAAFLSHFLSLSISRFSATHLLVECVFEVIIVALVIVKLLLIDVDGVRAHTVHKVLIVRHNLHTRKGRVRGEQQHVITHRAKKAKQSKKLHKYRAARQASQAT